MYVFIVCEQVMWKELWVFDFSKVAVIGFYYELFVLCMVALRCKFYFGSGFVDVELLVLGAEI